MLCNGDLIGFKEYKGDQDVPARLAYCSKVYRVGKKQASDCATMKASTINSGGYSVQYLFHIEGCQSGVLGFAAETRVCNSGSLV